MVKLAMYLKFAMAAVEIVQTNSLLDSVGSSLEKKVEATISMARQS